MKPEAIIIHHVGANNSFHSVNAYHKKKWNFKSKLGWYIGYHYFIDNSGKLFKGREETEDGAHKKGWNDKAVGICLRGNLQARKPTKQQLKTLRELLQDIQKRLGIPNDKIYAHKELSATLCPGKNLMSFIHSYRKYMTETTDTPTKPPKTPQKPSESVTEPTLTSLQAQIERIKAMLLNLLKKLRR